MDTNGEIMEKIFICAPYTTEIKDGIYKNQKQYYLQVLNLTDDSITDIYLKKFSIERNIEIAKKTAQYLRKAGYNVFCPHVAIAGYCDDMDDNKKDDRDKILKMCFDWIRICDYIAILPYWEESDGCQKEYKLSKELNKKVIKLTYKQIGYIEC